MKWVIISRLRLGKLIPNPRKLSYRKVHYHFPLISSIICRHSGHTADVYANFARGRRGLLTRQIKRNANEDKMRLLRCRVSPKSNNKSTAENKNKLQKGNNKLLLPQSTSLPLPQSTATQSDDHSLCIFKFSVSVRFGTLNKTVRVRGPSISDQYISKYFIFANIFLNVNIETKPRLSDNRYFIKQFVSVRIILFDYKKRDSYKINSIRLVNLSKLLISCHTYGVGNNIQITPW